jgi:hypothetical protein
VSFKFFFLGFRKFLISRNESLGSRIGLVKLDKSDEGVAVVGLDLESRLEILDSVGFLLKGAKLGPSLVVEICGGLGFDSRR